MTFSLPDFSDNAQPNCPTHSFVVLHGDLMRLARRLAANESEAQDLAQETILRLWRRRDDLGSIDDLRAYARAALRNLYRQGLRRAPFLPLEETDAPAIESDVFATLALSDLQGAIARLPSDQARLISLVMAGETSPNRLATRVDCEVNTVMSRLARARAQLRREMDLAPGAPVASLL